ncbi:MAG: protein ndvB, partial [Anaerolineales bacterium]|nr:protein ndvB [Anaerolineales bacterium]
IFSIRREIHLPPGQSVELIALLGVADSRERALRLLGKYRDAAVIERAFEIAWASTQLKLRSLRIHPDEARRFQKLASYLLYPSTYLRPPADRLEENHQGQAGLWQFGISGDLPILLVTITDVSDLGLVRQLLQAQAYWKQHGLLVDLVILNEESSSYDQPLMKRLENLIQSSSIYTGEDQAGSAYLLAVDQIKEEDLLLLQAVARVSLVAARGPLAQQIGVPHETIEEPDLLDSKRVNEEPSRPLPFLDLHYFNSLGGFSADGKEYVIYLGPNTHTPAPWINVIANPHFGTILSEKGTGFTWFGNSQRNRLTDWSNDPVLDPHSEVIYIRDEDSGEVWNPTAGPIRERNAYRVSHGAGYSRFEHNSHAIEQLLTVFVPTDEAGGKPLKISKLRLRNDSKKTRHLSVTYYLEWTLGERREMTQQHVVTEWEPRPGLILARNGYHPDYIERVAFASITPDADSFTCDRTVFLGRNQGTENPAALERVELSGRVGAGLDPCAALQTKLELSPGETVDVICVLGQGESENQAKTLARKYREVLSVNQAFEETKTYWDQILDQVQIETPEMSVNFLLNRWLLYQSLSCRIWGRSAFYQSGGAFGYRDQLQDVAAFLLTEPALAREHILLAASRQYSEGDVQHWWHPPDGAGVRTRISDDLLWLPFITAQYVRVTGDLKILQEQIPFLNAPELEPDQHEIFLEPRVSLEKGSLFEHCRRAVEKGLTQGPHGLPLIGTGDWNDGMNRVGEKGRGESVWLGWFLIHVLNDMEWLASTLGEEELAEGYQQEIEDLESRIEKAAWDGAWYIRGTFDDGSLLGSANNLEARIDSLPQSWSWISAAGDPARKAQALESAWRQLVREDERLVLLFTPPFDVSQPSPGYIKGYPPGVRENGGQYTHAALWLALAFARQGDGNRAGEILRILNPIEHAREDIDVWRYTVEPYVVAADVYRLPGRIGQGGWSWYTGSAAWMYRVWIEEVLGLKKRGDRLVLDPVIPDWWEGFNIQLRHGEAVYEIEVLNPDHVQGGIAWMELDGRPIEEDFIDLDPQPVKHTLRIQLGHQTE